MATRGWMVGVVAVASWSTGSLGHADVVRWINPAGGHFDDGANWDRGTPPGAADVARIDLPGAYTVTFPAVDVQLNGLWVVGTGNPTLAFGGTVRLGVPGSSGSGLVVSGAARFEGGMIVMGAGNVSIMGAPFVAVENVITDKAVGAGRNSSGQIGGEVHGARVTVRSNHINGSIHQSGFGGEYVYFEGGTVSGGGGGGGEGTIVQGVHFSGGAQVHGPSSWFGLQMSGDVVVEGEGTLITGLQRINSGTTRVRDGGTLGAGVGPSLWGSARLNIEPGGIVECRVEPLAQSTVRIESGSIGPRLMVSPAQENFNPRIELKLDGADLAGWGERLITTGSGGYGGRVFIEIVNANALRVGDRVQLFQSGGFPMAGSFTSVEVPLIGGGRVVQVSAEPYQVLLTVGAGGEPCWPADFDGDGDSGTDQDIAAFFACLAGDCCALCGSGDFNSDGDFGTDQDIEAFFRVLGGGSC